MNAYAVRHFLNGVCELIRTNLDLIEKTRYDITIKADGTPVTKSDLLVEELVRDYVEEKIGYVTFIGEESFDFNAINPDQYIVLLDPIDGTENFCSGLKEWGVSFSLWKGNDHLGSVIFLPEMGISLVTGDELMPVHSRIVGISSSMSDTLIETLRGPDEYRILGCAVYNLYNVIRGSFKRFINPKGAYVWDLLPGMMLALEHGCRVMVDGQLYKGDYLLDPTRIYKVDITRSD